MKSYLTKTSVPTMVVVMVMLLLNSCAHKFVTEIVPETNGIRRIITADISGEEMLYISEIDGAVSLSALDGSLSWRIPSDNPAVMFEIIATDLNDDGDDDLLGVSASGSVYAWSSAGELIWKYTTPNKVRLCQIATVGSGNDMRIFTGGNDYTLYELDRAGKQLSATKVEGSILYIESGEFFTKGKEDIFLFTLRHDKLNSEFFGFVDGDTKQVIKSGSIYDVYKGQIDISAPRLTPATSLIVNKVNVGDPDKDGLEEVILSGHADCGYTYVINGNLECDIECFGDVSDGQYYAHAISASLSPIRDQIVMQYGGVMRVYDLEGNNIATVGERYTGIIFNDFVVVPSKSMLIGAGQVGGDNTLYCFDLTRDDWYNTEHKFGGREAEVNANIAALYQDALSFKRPDYQPKQRNEFVVSGVENISPEVLALTDGEIVVLGNGGSFAENTNRDHMVAIMGDVALKEDRRRRYVNTREEIVEAVRAKEIAGEPFEIWVGHGNDPFFIQIETIEQMIAAAPNTCRGLIYAEMAGAKDPRMIYFVEEYMPRIADAIHKNNAKTKLYFRYKNMFWAADCHESIWKKVFFSGKYNDILAPAAEDTNNRLQDLNFAGRVGMWMSGYVDDYAIRIVNDNPTSWRPYSPGGQRSLSLYLRNAALLASYGARLGVFNLNYLDDSEFDPFFALITSGLIPKLKPEDILSVGSWHLISNIDHNYLDRVNNGHDLMRYSQNDDNAVVSLAGVHWCGVDLPSHDYSKIASGVDYRWLNFIPPMPNGMVPITESEYSTTLDKGDVGYVVSDIHHGIVDGEKVDAKQFGATMRDVVESGGRTMLMRVDGASWSLFRVGEKHARLVLIDPGYIDPSERDVTITLQGMRPVSARNILSSESISIDGDIIKYRVPAGSICFIDFEYSQAI